ncbi:MAG: hypothetical protein HKP21_01610 [Xanthomonadales bacterium]|nr:hypothetical protein [Gammaproteobacteria bacterium]MBT8072381.1 hypothetical protein [Gammaproteobacteria bacterium]NNK03221.1 hypothetical protein [Xanthomonadales bacterium]NNK98987.1 hypothetical protein [Xanthomonadales bacterium]
MNVYFGTVARGAPVSQGGSLFKLDWDRKAVVREVPDVPVNPSLYHDPNARGNVRGVRGIRICNDEVYAANYHTVNVFDRDLNPKRRITHGLMVGLHETQVVDSSIWVTSTTLDAALRYRLDDGVLEESFWPREMPAFQQALEIEPLAIDKSIDNRTNFLERESFRGPSHLHLNAVWVFRGEVYALFHSMSCVANLTRGTIVIQDNNLKHAHNLIMEEPGVVYINDTHRTVVRKYELDSGRQVRAIDIKRMPGIKSLLLKSAARAIREMGVSFFGSKRKATAKPLYLRGLSVTDDFIFAGFSPATIVRIDKKSGELIDAYYHSTDLRMCIHGLTADASPG